MLLRPFTVLAGRRREMFNARIARLRALIAGEGNQPWIPRLQSALEALCKFGNHF